MGGTGNAGEATPGQRQFSEAKSGGFDVITTEGAEEGVGLVLHEPKTLVDMSKAMDNHHYKFDATFGPASTNAQIFECALRP